MLGYHITVFRRTDDRPGPFTRKTVQGEKLGVWQTDAGGLFWLDELVEAGEAIFMGGNVVFAFSLIWISNPLTWIPLYTPCYLIGAKILGLQPIALNQFTTLRLNLEFGYHYVALWLGCLIIGISLSAIVHFLINRLWRSQVRSEWKSRQQRRYEKAKNKANN